MSALRLREEFAHRMYSDRLPDWLRAVDGPLSLYQSNPGDTVGHSVGR